MVKKYAVTDWKPKKILKGKKIIVTGCSSGIGWETAKDIKKLGGTVLGVDLNMTTDNVDEFYKADLSDKMTIEALVDALPSGVDGIANIAGVPPTAPAELVLKVNLVGLKYFTELMVPKLADGASIVNLASLAGFGWAEHIDQIKASYDLDFHEVANFVHRYGIDQEQGRSYFFTKDRKVMDRPGLPTDVAPVVCFMLSDMTTWMRGLNIPVDGGMSSHLLCNIHNL